MVKVYKNKMSGSNHPYYGGLSAKSGALSNSAAATTVVLNSKAGGATFTGQTITTTSSATLTITNSQAGSGGVISLYNADAGTVGSNLYIRSATWTAGTSIAVVVANVGAQSNTGNIVL